MPARPVLARTSLVLLGAVGCQAPPALPDAPDDAPALRDTSPNADARTGALTPRRRVVYQLVPRLFSNTAAAPVVDGTLAQNGSGHFADIDARALGELADLGVTDLWLTGALRQATLTDWSSVDPRLTADDPDIVKGRAGSFYAIRDYYDVSPDYAVDPAHRLDEFDALIERTHTAGLRVLIDLVPNHVARSYASVVYPERDFGVGDDTTAFASPRNNFYYLVDPPGQALQLRRPAHWNPSGVVFDGRFAREDGAPGRPPRATGNNQTQASLLESDWYETVKLNYGFDFAAGLGTYDPMPRTWTQIDAILAYWQARGVDGFRCDFAHYVPTEAWRSLIASARRRDPEVFFVAEAYENLEGLLAAGFDSVYHDAAYDTLKAVYQGRAGQGELDGLLGSIRDSERGRWLHYLENHDERRMASPIVAGGSADDSGFGGANAIRQLGPLLFLVSPGPLLVYNGQEVGEPAMGSEGFGGDDGRTSIFDYGTMPALARWVNGHAYDGGASTAEERSLREYYRALLRVAHDPSVAGSRYWGLDSWNATSRFRDANDALYSYARFETGSRRAVVVVANFAPGAASTGTLRMPGELLDAIGFRVSDLLTVREILSPSGAVDRTVTATDRAGLVDGIVVTVADQGAVVYVIE